MAGDVGPGYPGDGLRHCCLCGPGSGQQLRIAAIGAAHHFALRADEVSTVVAVAEYFIGPQLVGSFGLYTPIHPMQLYVRLARRAFEFERDMGRRRTTVREVARLEFADIHAADTAL